MSNLALLLHDADALQFNSFTACMLCAWSLACVGIGYTLGRRVARRADGDPVRHAAEDERSRRP